jgi:DNA-binding NtrC family response regulator
MGTGPQHNVLIVSADREVVRILLRALAGKAVHGEVATSKSAATRKLDASTWDLMIVDADALGEETPDFVRWARRGCPELPMGVLVGDHSLAPALRSLLDGCEGFLVKSFGTSDVDGLLERLLPSRPACATKERGAASTRIVGHSAPLRRVLADAERVAPTSMPILITGESGTGKELISSFVHHCSRRCEGPYIRVNCAAVNESLLESELFGHEQGAFTGASRQRKGLFERAHGGTLLLDEISETGGRLQAQLLRVLEQQDFERVGGSESVRVNVRIISTTNRDLAREARKGRFRQDLYYRLSGACLGAPPLRERPEDIEALVWHFVEQFATETRRRVSEIPTETLAALRKHPWPGNVRQLRNVVRTSLAMGSGPRLTLKGVGTLQPDLSASGEAEGSLALREVERQTVLKALRRTNSHYVRAAELLGITDRTLREKVRRYRDDGTLGPAGESTWLTQTA